MRIAVVHNLGTGGARRRLVNQLEHSRHDWQEVCLQTAEPVDRARARIVPLRQRAPSLPRAARVPVRHTDLAALVAAWHRAARVVRGLGVDAVYVGPCRYLQSPPLLATRGLPPALYFCDEPRRIDHEPEARATTNPRTRALYAGLYAAQRRLDARAARAADRIATNSRYTASAIRAAYGREAEPVVLGVGPEFARTPAGTPRHLLSVGTIIPTKGHDLVIRAAALARERRPVVIVGGRGGEGEADRLRAIAAGAGVELSIRQGIGDAELRRAYADAYVTLYMAQREPLGLVSLEAQACGCPMIVAAEGGLPETIDEGRSGWAVPRDPAAIAARIDAVAHEDRATLDAACRAAAARWSWPASAARIDDLLDELVSR